MKIGDFVSILGQPYILAATDADHYCFICLNGGDRWQEPIRIEGNRYDFTDDQVDLLIDSDGEAKAYEFEAEVITTDAAAEMIHN